jgi:hypothetical protein
MRRTRLGRSATCRTGPRAKICSSLRIFVALPAERQGMLLPARIGLLWPGPFVQLSVRAACDEPFAVARVSMRNQPVMGSKFRA